jgi:hypothetical protein
MIVLKAVTVAAWTAFIVLLCLYLTGDPRIDILVVLCSAFVLVMPTLALAFLHKVFFSKSSKYSR